MTSAPGTAARLARLLSEIAVDRQGLEARAEEIASLVQRTAGREPPRDDVVLVATNLHGW
jgi:hypothetical protein